MRTPERNPADIALCLLLAYAVFRIALFLDPLPGSLEEAPDYLGHGAALAIFVGSLLVLAGNVWRDRWNGLVIEQVGSLALGLGLLFYATALGFAQQWSSNASITVGITYGVGVMRFVRLRQIQKYFNQRRTEATLPAVHL